MMLLLALIFVALLIFITGGLLRKVASAFGGLLLCVALVIGYGWQVLVLAILIASFVLIMDRP